MQNVIDAPPPAPVIRGVIRLTARQLRAQRRVTLFLTLVPPIAIAAAIVLLWGRAIGGTDLAIMLAFYSFSLLGITVGFHRLFTHRSFIAARALRTVLATAGSMAIEGSVVSWVATHRRHHAFADEFGDPHSPHLAKAAGFRGVLLGLWHAHMGWLFDPDRTNPSEWAPDLLEDRAIMRVDRNFGRIVLASFLAPAAIGFLLTFSWHGMVTAFLWGSLVRIVLLHHVTWSINSICHFYGKDAYKSRDESRNVWPLAVPSFGESWHNNHHAFPWSARLGLRAWQIDPGWYTLLGLKAVGLVRGLKQPTREQMLAKRVRRGRKHLA